MGCFSPKTPKSKKNFFRRISGSETTSPSLHDSGSLNALGKKRNVLFKKHKKVPSSPARLLNGQPLVKKPQPKELPNEKVCIIDDDNVNDPYYLASRLKFDLMAPSVGHAKEVCHNSDVHKSDLFKSRAFEAEDRTCNTSIKPHKRAFSADASVLRRGKPNTPKNGLPDVTPNKYQRPPIPFDLLSPSSSSEKSEDSNKMDSDCSDTMVESPSELCVSDSAVKVVDCTVVGSKTNNSDCAAEKEADLSGVETLNESEDKTMTESINLGTEPMDAETGLDGKICEKILKESTSSSSVDSAVSSLSCVSSASVTSVGSIKSLESVDSGHEGSILEVSMDSADDVKDITAAVKQEQKPRLQPRAKDLLERVESFRSRKATDQFRKRAAVVRRPSMKEPKFQICSETHKLLTHSKMVENLPPVADDAESVEVMVVHPPTPGRKTSDSSEDKACHGSVLDLHAAAKVTQNVERFSNLCDEQKELMERHTSPLRFTHSNIKKRGLSPVRIPTIFAKNEKQAAHLREIARRVVLKGKKGKCDDVDENDEPDVHSIVVLVASPVSNPQKSKAKASLPISKNMAKLVSENAKKKFSVVSTSDSVMLEKKDSCDLKTQNTVTPRRTDSRKRSMKDLTKLIRPMKLVPDKSEVKNSCGESCSPNKLPLQDSSNTQTATVGNKRTLPSLPKIKQAALSTKDITSALLKKKISVNTPENKLRKLQLQNTPRRCRSPMKPVKRLASPSPKKSPKHYPSSPIHPFRRHPRRSNGKSAIPTHVMEDVNVY